MRRSVMPFERAMVMKSSCSVAIRSFRKRRKYTTIEPMARMIEGRIIELRLAERLWLMGT